MKNIFTILKSMFSSQEETANAFKNETIDNSSSIISPKTPDKYIASANDIRIIAGDATLVITDDKRIGGLWVGVSNYDPCSGTEQECFEAMRNLISDNFEEACETLMFKLNENLYLINIADSHNRSKYDEDELFYLHLCEDKIGVFYPIIKNFIDKHSGGKYFGVTICFGSGTSIGLCNLVNRLKKDGYYYYVLGTTLPFLNRKKESWSERHGKNIDNFEWFDCIPYIDKSKSLKKFYEEDIEVIFDAMKAKVTDMLSSYLESEKKHDTINKENETDKPDELTHEAKLPGQVQQVNEVLDQSVNNGSEISQTELRIHNGVVRPNYTPNAISTLKADEVFVFGSNLHGHHGGGAARVAWKNFGAIRGQGVGLQGQSYAIPTMQGGVETVKPYVDQFIDFAKEHTELFFYVTRIGCGIAGFKDRDIAPLFKDAMEIANICLPESFIKANEAIINSSKIKEMISDSNSDMVIHYGQVRTMVDILIGLNEVHHFLDSQEAINEVEKYIASQNQDHSSISAMAFHVIADILHSPFAFVNGKLNDAKIKEVFIRPKFQHTWENALYKYRFAKIWKLICYFNEFRRYSSPYEIIEDLKSLNLYHYFEMTDSAWGARESGVGGHPWNFFTRAITNKWNFFAPNGVLNPELINKYMFENHEISLRTIGLEATIQKDFRQAGCWADVYFPKEFGTAPIYFERKVGNRRRFIKSCGEGIGPNQYPESLEIRYAHVLLLHDPKYELRGSYDRIPDFFFVPIHDQSLPIYSVDEKLVFENEYQKQSFLEKEVYKYVSDLEDIKNYIYHNNSCR